MKVQGSITAEQNVSIAAANYLQRAGKLQGTTINLATVQDIRLQGGKVIGQDIAVAAGTHLYSGSTLTSGGDTLLLANHDINVIGSSLKSGQGILAQAGNDIAIVASTDRTEVQYEGGGNALPQSARLHQNIKVIYG